MNVILRLAYLVTILSLAVIPPCAAQSTRASASETSASSSGASTISIRQEWLAQQQAALKRALSEVQRCIKTATNQTTLRDPQGNINQVPQTDVINCTRKLKQLQRQLASLQRKAAALGSDAQFEAAVLSQKLRQLQRQSRLRGLTSQGQLGQ